MSSSNLLDVKNMEIKNLNLKLFLWYLHNKLRYSYKFRLILSHYWKLNRWHLEQKQFKILSLHIFLHQKNLMSTSNCQPNRGKINSHFSNTSDSSQLYFIKCQSVPSGGLSVYFFCQEQTDWSVYTHNTVLLYLQ